MSITQFFTTGAGGCLDAVHQALNMGDQNIGVLQQTLTGICNLVGTLEQNMHHVSHNGKDQLIRGSSNNSPGGDFELRISTFTV